MRLLSDRTTSVPRRIIAVLAVFAILLTPMFNVTGPARVAAQDAMTAPDLSRPDDQSVTRDTTPRFTWQSVRGARGYAFELARDPQFSDLVVHEDGRGRSYSMRDPLSEGTTYFWRVSAQSKDGENSPWSATRVLTIEGEVAEPTDVPTEAPTDVPVTEVPATEEPVTEVPTEEPAEVDETETETVAEPESRTSDSNTVNESAAASFAETNGTIMLEAEAADRRTSRSNRSWVTRSDLAGYQGSGFVRVEIDGGMAMPQSYTTKSPELEFTVDFATSGTYHVWVRAYATGGADDSLHAGLDGVAVASADQIQLGATKRWVWTKTTIGGSTATLAVKAGTRTVNLWMREDGVRVDQVLLTTDASYVPAADSAPAPITTPAPTKTTPAGTTAVTQLMLVNADTGADIGPLTDGATLDFATLPTRRLSVRAEVAGTVGSVVFGLDGNARFRTENSAPYTLAGDSGNNYSPWTPAVGSRVLTATPYTKAGAGGTVGTVMTVRFTVVEVAADTAPVKTATPTKTATPSSPATGADTNGTILLEAEAADRRTSRSNRSWVTRSDLAGYQGSGFVRVEIDGGMAMPQSYTTKSPELEFTVDFATSGTYHVWVRAYATGGGDDSLHAGLDGVAVASADQIQLGATKRWVWTKTTIGGSTATLAVKAGTRTVNLWMREDGLRVDQVLLTTDASYVPGGADAPPATTPAPTKTPVTPVPTAVPGSGSTTNCGISSPARRVNVATASQLSSALANARAGDLIMLADGTYTGKFTATADGTASNPITVCGSRKAIVRQADLNGTTIFFNAAAYWKLDGFTVRNGVFGVRVERSRHIQLRNLDLGNTGQSGILLRFNSTDTVLANSWIHDTGISTAEYGEGIYIGQNEREWVGGTPDRTDRTQILDNKFGPNIRAEAVDVKEGASNGVVRGNTFDGSAMTANVFYVDSWVDIKGNSWMVEDNSGAVIPIYGDAYEVTGSSAGWGINNTFRDNYGDVRVRSGGNGRMGVHIPVDLRSKNVVGCDNVFINVDKYSMPDCTP